MMRHSPFVAALVLGTTVTALSSCKPARPPVVVKNPDGTVKEAPPPPDEATETRAQALAKEAQSLAQQGDEAGAESKRDELAKAYPGTAAGAEVLFDRAMQAKEAGRAAEALSLFETLLLHRPDFAKAAQAREAYGELLIAAGRHAHAAEVMRPLFDEASSAQERARLGDILARALQHTEQAKEALEIQVALRNTSGLTPEARQKAERAAVDIVSHKLSFNEAQELWDEVKNNREWQFLQALLAFKLAKIYYHTRQFERSQQMLELMVTRYQDSEYAPRAQDLLTRIERRFKVDPKAIGVVLPLSGRFKQYGERSLAAIKLQFPEGSGYRLVVKDSAGDPTAASKAVEDLVLENHVIAIIGPQFSKPSHSAALKAEELSVPILLLSHREGLPGMGEYVFRTALTVEAQAEALAKVAFEDMGWSRFALLYPNSSYGADFIHAFWDEVDRRKGEIRGVERYENDQTTFSAEVKSLVGRYFTYARGEYLRRLAELRAQKLPSHRYRTALAELGKNLPPVVDFDAIVIPDSGRRVGLIAPAIAVEDVVLTRNPEMLKTLRRTLGKDNVHPVTLMGGSTWNSYQTVESCERYCEDSLFVDGYWSDNPDPIVRTFVSKFREATDAEPFLADAQAYDTAGLLRWIFDSANPPSRAKLRDLLTEQSSYQGVTGPVRFNEQGEVQKELYRLTIKEREIRRWTPPQEPPQG